MRPRRTAWSRVTSENNVLFPAPLSPSSTLNVAGWSANVTSSSAWREPYQWLRPSIASAASADFMSCIFARGPSRPEPKSLRRNGDAPGQLADLNRLDHLQGRDVDHRDVVGHAVRGEQIFLVGRERHVPDPLSDQQIFLHVVRGAVDDGHAIGRTERDETGPAVPGDADADRLNRFLAQARNLEADLLRYLMLRRIDHAQGSADLGGDPQFRPVALELCEARTRIDQNIGHDRARLGIDEMRHVGGFRGIHQDLAVGADAHSLGLDPDLHVAEPGALLHVDDGDRVVVL